MAKVEIKSKEAKMKAAMSGGASALPPPRRPLCAPPSRAPPPADPPPHPAGKAKRKKWSKGKVREKLQNLVQFDQKTYDRMMAEVPKMKVVTIATMSERFKIGGSLARVGLRELVSKGLLKCAAPSSKMPVYTRIE